MVNITANHRCFGCQVIEGYGMTETSCVISIMDESDTSSGHVGSPNPACGKFLWQIISRKLCCTCILDWISVSGYKILIFPFQYVCLALCLVLFPFFASRNKTCGCSWNELHLWRSASSSRWNLCEGSHRVSRLLQRRSPNVLILYMLIALLH